MNTNETKRKYVKPAFRTIALHSSRSMILCGSGELGNRSPYDPTDENPFGGE